MSDWANVQWVGDPLLEVALPGDMEQVSRNPKADDREMPEMGGEELW